MRDAVLKKIIAGVILIAALTSCGGGTGTGGPSASGGTGGTGISVGTITAFGSIVVNGVHFDETGAIVVINDAPGSGNHQGLQIGMTVKIKATFNGDGTTASATDIEAEHQVEGFVEPGSIVPNTSFRVLGHTVYVDQLLDPSFDFSTIEDDAEVEVYGLRDGNGAIHATLIEVEPSNFEEEIRGTISQLDTVAMRFNIGALVVRYDGNTDFEHGTATDLRNGATVEVHVDTSNNSAYATKIEFEDVEDSGFNAGNGEKQEVEGYVSNYNSATDTFTIGNVVVRLTSSTVRRPSNAVVTNGIPVTVRGTTLNGELIASEIELH